MTEPESRPPGAGPETDVPAAHAPLQGAWRKTTSEACAEAYPDEIEFFEHRFLGRKGPGQGFVRWDVGGYEVSGPDEIRVATATDERVAYEFSVEGDELTFVDPEGCRVTYARAAGAEGGR
ncbi:MAG: hypothetical protein ACRDNI_10345 [Gaiellaceae bacterium]